MTEPATFDIFTDNHRWGDLDDWNRSALAMHEQGGIHRIERDGFQPFWAVIDHAAVLDIERQPELFTNGPEPVLSNDEAIAARQLEIKTLIHMDAPEHNKYRRLTNDRFKPASVRRLNDRLTELSLEAVATLEANGGSCDFATEIALPYPLQVILRILGLPEEDFPRMMMLTQQLFGGEDPDLATAGHDTTSSAMAGGMQALIDNPDQLAKLQENPEPVANAVEHFCLGAQLARNEIRSLFSHVVPRIESIELAGDPTTMKTTFVGGHKTLPIRYTLNEG